MDWLGAHAVKSSNPLEVLEFGSNPHPPDCKDRHDVLIKVHYTDVNAMDVEKLVGSGEKRADVPNKDLSGGSGPLIPGHGGSGVVETCPSDPSLVGKPVCFLAPRGGSYASYVVTDIRCVAELPNNTTVDPEVAAAIPVSGLCALETLAKLGLAKDASVAISDTKDGTLQKVTAATCGTQENKTMLVVGASGGVGSWILTLIKAWHPHITVVATACKENEEWCKSLGAAKVIGHDEITSKLDPNTVDYAICLTEATQQVFGNLTHIIQPYGTIALLVQGKGMKTINMTSIWDKSVSVVTHSILTAPQTNYQQSIPADSLKLLVRLLAQQTIQVPMSPDVNADASKLSVPLKPDVGLLVRLWQQPKKHPQRGKYVLQITTGDHLIFLDFKTGAIVPIARKDIVARKLLTKAASSTNNSHSVWKEEAKLDEKNALLEKVTKSKTLGIVKQADKQVQDYEDGLEMQEAENVKNLWGVSLKKREKNKAGEEFMFVDARFGCIGELSRKQSIEKGIITVADNPEATDSEMKQVVLEAAELTEEERADLISEVRMGLKIGME